MWQDLASLTEVSIPERISVRLLDEPTHEYDDTLRIWDLETGALYYHNPRR